MRCPNNDLQLPYQCIPDLRACWANGSAPLTAFETILIVMGGRKAD